MPEPDLPATERSNLVLRGLFLLALAMVTVFALMPPSAIPQTFHFWDKLQHALAYAALAIVGGLAFPGRRLPLVVGLVLHGAAIESMQAALTTTRHADPADWLADCLGIAVGLLALAAGSSAVRTQPARRPADVDRRRR